MNLIYLVYGSITTWCVAQDLSRKIKTFIKRESDIGVMRTFLSIIRFTIVHDNVAGQFPAEVFRRAVNYLYTKETRSSVQIQREAPTTDRLTKFTRILQNVGEESISELLTEKNLTYLQNKIVDTRLAIGNSRDYQNFIAYLRSP